MGHARRRAARHLGALRSIFTTKEQERRSDEYEEEAFDDAGDLRQAKALSINKIGHATHDLDPTFSAFSHTADLAAVAADVGMADPRVLQSMYIVDPEPYPTDGLVPLEAKAGTLVVLHGLVPHLSGPNRSARSRHAFTLHAIEGGTAYPTDNWLQRPDLPLPGFAPELDQTA